MLSNEQLIRWGLTRPQHGRLGGSEFESIHDDPSAEEPHR